MIMEFFGALQVQLGMVDFDDMFTMNHGFHNDGVHADVLRFLIASEGMRAARANRAANQAGSSIAKMMKRIPTRTISTREIPIVIDDEIEDDENCCSICLDAWEAGARVVVLPCGHQFHSKCAVEWFKARAVTSAESNGHTNDRSGRAVCPSCRGDVLKGLNEQAKKQNSKKRKRGSPSAPVEESSRRRRTTRTTSASHSTESRHHGSVGSSSAPRITESARRTMSRSQPSNNVAPSSHSGGASRSSRRHSRRREVVVLD